MYWISDFVFQMKFRSLSCGVGTVSTLQYSEYMFKTVAQQTRPSLRETCSSFSEGTPVSSPASPGIRWCLRLKGTIELLFGNGKITLCILWFWKVRKVIRAEQNLRETICWKKKKKVKLQFTNKKGISLCYKVLLYGYSAATSYVLQKKTLRKAGRSVVSF